MDVKGPSKRHWVVSCCSLEEYTAQCTYDNPFSKEKKGIEDFSLIQSCKLFPDQEAILYSTASHLTQLPVHPCAELCEQWFF